MCGAGGDRDPSRRPLIAALAATYADNIISLASKGLFTLTTHARDVEWNRLVMLLSDDLALKKVVQESSSDQLQTCLPLEFPQFYQNLMAYMSRFKIERSQTDHLENDLPYQIVFEKLKGSIITDQHLNEPLFYRTKAGFMHHLKQLESRIREYDRDFDFDSFANVMLLAWEISAMTDNERHIQHRLQFLMRSHLLKLERALHSKNLLPQQVSVFNLNAEEILDMFDNLRELHGPRN